MFAKHVNPEISFFGMDLTNVMSVLDLIAIKQLPYKKTREYRNNYSLLNFEFYRSYID